VCAPLRVRRYYLVGPLDQGWFPDGLYTAATDQALQSDLVAMKKMGMNSVRKHMKVPAPSNISTTCQNQVVALFLAPA
jgi:hypothetical protein